MSSEKESNFDPNRVKWTHTNAVIPERLSQCLLFHDKSTGCNWHIRAVINWWPLSDPHSDAAYRKLVDAFRYFLEIVDYPQLQLQADTVTHITFTLADPTSIPPPLGNNGDDGGAPGVDYFIDAVSQLRCDVGVDKKRIRYPRVDALRHHRSLPKYHCSCVTTVRELDCAIHLVEMDGVQYVHKLVHRTYYHPTDSEHIMDEIDAYIAFRGGANIAQIAGLVVSENPYKTAPVSLEKPENRAEVIVGFLLPYYGGGNLWDLTSAVLDGDGVYRYRLKPGSPVAKWARQIGLAIKSMHDAGRAHVDVKPGNVVLDSEGNAKLIDISGTGGWTWEYLSPEMDQIVKGDEDINLGKIPFEIRVGNDYWGYALILDALVRACVYHPDVVLLGDISAEMMLDKPEDRLSLTGALAKLGASKT
ncbi:kinase-like domain-containing protein [Aspergillus heterothallicus]